MTTGKDVSIYTQVILKMWVELNKRFPASEEEWNDVSKFTYNLVANIERNQGYCEEAARLKAYKVPSQIEEISKDIDKIVAKNGSAF